MVTNDTADWLQCKQNGNDNFKTNKFEEALVEYTKALNLCEQTTDKCVVYRNRSACYLKLEKYNEAIEDCNEVLKNQPNDMKALFRRCQSYDHLSKLEPAYKDAKRLIQMEPKNTAVQQLYRRLTHLCQDKISKSQSTVNMVNEMVEALTNPSETEDRKKQSMSNLVIYAHQPTGRDVLLKGNYLPKLLTTLTTDTQVVYLMKICHGFCENSMERSFAVLQQIPTKRFYDYITGFTKSIDLVSNALSVIVTIIKAMVENMKIKHKLDAKDEQKNVKIREFKENVRKSLEDLPPYISLLNLLVQLLSEPKIVAEARDAVIDAFIQVTGLHKAIGDFILSNRGVKKMLELASLSCFTMLKEKSSLPVSELSYIHVSVVLSTMYDHIQYYDKEVEKFNEQAETVINRMLNSSDNKTNLQGLVALSAIIMASRESGQSIATKNDNIRKVLELACKPDDVYQRFAAETLALAATDKSVCNTIADIGLDVLKKLYQSPNNDIRVRSLVALCKVSMKGSGNVKEQILSDDGAVKLYQTCRKFLLNPNKEFSLKKWSCEGVAYLTLDADVKETLVHDTEALKGLLDLAGADDSTITYGICNALVNLTNSYDKPEKNPELEEIAKFAKQPLPQPHEKDSEDFIKKRIDTLMENGLITALVNFTKVKSKNTQEMMARIFHAVVEDVGLRGKVVAQGGVKTLLPLALEGTDKGMDFAGQALAKIGITNDPRLAFSGQRCMEVVRPLIKMLHFSKEPLLRFESLMALTNLASMNDEVRKRIMKEKGFQEIESLMFDDDEQLKQAATECMCNLVLCDEAFNMYKLDTDTERVKLVTLYCGEDPPTLARAAAGTLAILTSDIEICRKVVGVKSHLEIIKYLVTSENLELRHRGLFILANLIDSDREIATQLIEDELFEALNAIKCLPTTSDIIQKELQRCFDNAQKWELIAVNAPAA